MVLTFLAEGFEEIEALTPVDVLRRADVTVRTVAIGAGNGKTVTGSHGIPVVADLTAEEALALTEKIEMVILPGGMPGAKNLEEDKTVTSFLRKSMREGFYVASICAAPMIPGKMGMLRGKRATCYPGFEQHLDEAILTGGRVEIDCGQITANGMGSALDFALTLCGLLKGDEAAEKIRSAILAK